MAEAVNAPLGEGVKVSRAALVRTVVDVMDKATINPAEELIACGEALAEIGRALRGLSVQEAKAVMRAAFELAS